MVKSKSKKKQDDDSQPDQEYFPEYPELEDGNHQGKTAIKIKEMTTLINSSYICLSLLLLVCAFTI